MFPGCHVFRLLWFLRPMFQCPCLQYSVFPRSYVFRPYVSRVLHLKLQGLVFPGSCFYKALCFQGFVFQRSCFQEPAFPGSCISKVLFFQVPVFPMLFVSKALYFKGNASLYFKGNASLYFKGNASGSYIFRVLCSSALCFQVLYLQGTVFPRLCVSRVLCF